MENVKNQFVPRIQKLELAEKIKDNKLVLIQGPRKVGKKTLVLEVLDDLKANYTLLNCNEKKAKKAIENRTVFKELESDFVVLYEAQYLINFESIVESILMGEIRQTTILVCSYIPSMNPELREAIKQSELELNFFAPSFYESAQHFGLPYEDKLLEERLIYGSYPEVLSDLEFAEVKLREIIDEAIFTTFRAGERINKADKLIRMLQLLAFNIGETISYNDIAERCGLDNETVERYIDLLEDAFVLIRLKSYHNDHRYELKKANMVYFADNGIRNVLISNFNPTFLRNDMNQLWKNYLVAERIKWMRMNRLDHKVFFWRTHTKQQLDFLEVKETGIVGYKTDWEKRKKVKFPLSFEEAYPNAKTSPLNRSTYWKFLTQKK